MKSSYADVIPYVTKDGSEIRELMHPARHCNRLQSLAEATVAPGARTALHRHGTTEEIYHITHGRGRMTLNAATFDVNPGDTICIAPGTAALHRKHRERGAPYPVRVFARLLPRGHRIALTQAAPRKVGERLRQAPVRVGADNQSAVLTQEEPRWSIRFSSRRAEPTSTARQKFSEMSAGGKLVHVGKVVIFIISFGFAFPTLFSD